MPAQLLTNKQLFCPLSWEGILPCQSLDLLKASVAEHEDTLSPKDKEKWQTIFALLDALPDKDVYSYPKRGMQKAVVGVGAANTKSTHNEDIPDYPDSWGWNEVVQLAPLLKTINTWIDDHSLSDKIHKPSSAVQSVVKWKKRLDGGEYQHKVFDPAGRLAEAEGCAIFIPDSQGGGFLDGRGQYGAPLSGARLFESSGSAYTTIRSRSLIGAIVVHVKSNLLRIDENNTVSTNEAGPLLDAVALMERKRLEEALKEASVEQLRARLNELEGSAPSKPAEQPTRRRM